MPFYRRPIKSFPTPSPRHQPNPAPQRWGRIAVWCVLIAFIAGGIILYRSSHVPAPYPGVIVSESPEQNDISDAESIDINGYTVTPIATYSIRARVLSTKHYKTGRDAELSPVDLALGWDRMSDSEILDQIDIWQSTRKYYYQYYKKLPIDMTYIIQHSANTHIIPANMEIERTLKKVRKNNIVRMSGYLVNITAPDGYHWETSQTRADTGDGSCEVFLVTHIDVEKSGDF